MLLTPAHQYPTGAVMSGARRGALLEWLRRREAIAIEDDYDAEYRYDRAPVGALQGMDPERIVYAGTASKTLAPAMRLGWMVVPPRLLDAVQRQQRQVDFGVSRIEQHAFADFLSRGELDRHLRRMRARYRARRDALVEALTEALPEVRVHGIRAGLHVMIQLRDGDRGRVIQEEAARRGVALTALSDYYLDRTRGFVDAAARVCAVLGGGDSRRGAGAGGGGAGGSCDVHLIRIALSWSWSVGASPAAPLDGIRQHEQVQPAEQQHGEREQGRVGHPGWRWPLRHCSEVGDDGHRKGDGER